MKELFLMCLFGLWACHFGALVAPTVTGIGLSRSFWMTSSGTVIILSLGYVLQI